MKHEPTAEGLRAMLWDSTRRLRAGKLKHETANAIARQAREILRSVTVQANVLASKESLPADLVRFAGGKEKSPGAPKLVKAAR